MASTTVELEMFKPGTESWLESKIDFAHNTMVYLNRDAKHFYRVAKELIEYRAWEIYFEDEPKTWDRLLDETIGIEHPKVTAKILRQIASLIENQTNNCADGANKGD